MALTITSNRTKAPSRTSGPMRLSPKVRLVISDVDETQADLFVPVTGGMARQLDRHFGNRVLISVSGAGKESVRSRVFDRLSAATRGNSGFIHCSGAEGFGFSRTGSFQRRPIFSIVGDMLPGQKPGEWRRVMDLVIKIFGLKITDAGTKQEFLRISNNDPTAIMYSDRGPQITMEVINGHRIEQRTAVAINLKLMSVGLPVMERNSDGTYDLRQPIARYANSMLAHMLINITGRNAGEFALDFAIKGVTKTEGLRRMFATDYISNLLGTDTLSADEVEVWGDKFDLKRGGTDAHMLAALPDDVRAIDFRKNEDRSGFPANKNINVWNGNASLHLGLEEYLSLSKTP